MNQETKDKLIELGYKGGFGLSELIEACGVKFEILIKSNGEFACARWDIDSQFIIEKTDYFPTPEEAVANLWLELNKK